MNSHKYFKVKEIKSRNGTVIYKVFGADSKLGALFGIWAEYNKDNFTLDSAIEQIKNIFNYGITSEKVVYKTDVSSLTTKNPQ